MPYSIISLPARTILEVIAGLALILSTILCCLLVFLLVTTQGTMMNRRYRILLRSIQVSLILYHFIWFIFVYFQFHAYTLELGAYFLLHPIPLVPLSCFHFDSWVLHFIGIDGHPLFVCFLLCSHVSNMCIVQVILLTYFLLITIPYGLCFAYRHQVHFQPLFLEFYGFLAAMHHP